MNHFIIQLIENLKYIGIFIGAFIEGPATAFTGGVLIKSDFLKFAPTFIVHSLGDFSADMLYFLVGRFGSKKFLKWIEKIFHLSTKEINAAKERFKKHHIKIIFTGKLTHFLGLPAIIGIGLSDYSVGKFFIFNFIATIIKSIILITIGYNVGALWEKQESLFSRVGILILIITVILFLYVLMKKKNEKKI